MQLSRLQLLFLLCSAAGSAPAQAQQAPAPSTRDRFWLSGGFGSGRSGAGLFSRAALATGLAVTYQPGPVLFSVRVAGLCNILEGDLLGDAGFLVGLGTRGRRTHVSFAVGPALTGGSVGVFTRDSTSFSSRLGAAFQVQLLGLPLESIGIGVTGFANVNRDRSFGGVMISLAVGQLR